MSGQGPHTVIRFADWTIRPDAGRNPSHRGYREVIHRFWRMALVR